AKKSKPKKATAKSLPCGFPLLQVAKWESFETRFAQTAKLSYSIFRLASKAAPERIKVNSKVKSNVLLATFKLILCSVLTRHQIEVCLPATLGLVLTFPRWGRSNLRFAENGSEMKAV
ncbi:MAG: hypothetical protein KGM99_09325, partial [Burkholderiales bacterium]|nr:hypothetical protein [Burkholderiales bacterium]